MLFYIRVVLLTVYFLFACDAGLLVCCVRPFHKNNTRDCARILGWGRHLLGIRLHQVNDNPTADQQVVYISNHQNNQDVFVYTEVLPSHVAILGKSTLKYVPIFGLLFWLAGNIYINKKNRAKAWETMAAVATTVKRKGCSVYIFPEGTRSRGRGLLPFKSGAFALAIEAGLPVVPIVYSSADKNIDLNRLHAGTAMVKFLDPIATTGLGEDDVKAFAERCRAQVQQAIDEMDAELASANQLAAHS